MKNTCQLAMVMATAALSAVLLLAPLPGLGQAPAPTTAGGQFTRAIRDAQQFENQARVLTVFDREGKVVTTVGERAIYSQPVFSPDRTRLAVIKVDLESDTVDLWVLDVATGNSTRITSNQKRNEETATAPVWSPDGSQVAYVALRGGNEGLYRKAANGQGSEELLYQLPGAEIVLTDWSLGGRFLSYYSLQLGGNILYALPLEGERKPVELVRSPFQVLEARISPDNRFIAYRSNETGKNEIFVRAFNPTEAALPAAAAGPWQVSNNEGGVGLIYWRQDGTELYYMGADRGVKAVSVSAAAAFEFGKPRTLFKLPNAVPVTGTPGALGNIARDGQRVVFAVPPAPVLRQITVFDRQGKVLSTVGEPGPYGQSTLSPDGTRLAIVRNDRDTGNQDIWSFDMQTGKGTPVTSDTLQDFGPIWFPDGNQVAYVSTRGNYSGIYRRAWNGTGSEELLFRNTPGAGMTLTDVSPDGKFVTFSSSGSVVYVVALTGSDPLAREAIEFSREEFDTGWGRFSPDSRFMAYTSNEADPERREVYVRRFDASTGAAAAEGKWQVSKDGAGMILWRGDGKEMCFAVPDLQTRGTLVMAVDVATTPTFQAGTPKLLFKLPGLFSGWNDGQRFNISRDGQRFVFVMPVPVQAGTPAR